jgi:hypothetical protein
LSRVTLARARRRRVVPEPLPAAILRKYESGD